MAKCLSDEVIRRFVSGAMSAPDEVSVREHLSACESCRSRVDSRDQNETIERRATPNVGELPTIEGYDMLSRIHSGAQGVVYKAIQKSTGRPVAVKLLPHEQAATDRQKHRFEREVSLAASLRHPNIVTVYDSGLTSGRYYFAMEYIHGKPLDAYLRDASLTTPQTLRLFATICSAVAYAHQKGVIHRDLKPGNILVDAAGEPHVVDFGLAKSAGVVAMLGDSPFTLTSQFMGTLAYASPEQTMGDPALVDMRSDIYSLGVILFEMLTGAQPYPTTPDLVKMFRTICHESPRPPSSIVRSLDSDVDTIVLRAMAKEPQRRYQSVRDLQQDVERWLAGEAINARRDSLPYLVRVKTRRFVQRRQAFTAALVVAFATAAGILIGNWVLGRWSWPINAFEYVIASAFAPPAAGADEVLRDVRLIAIDDSTPDHIAALAAQEGFDDVRAEPWKSLRRLHGRLMQRLADADARAVVWDIDFPDNQPYNTDFIAGVRALQANGVNPVIGVGSWHIDAENPPGMAPDILAEGVAWGVPSMNRDTLAQWRMDLIVQRGATRLLGLDLVALAAMRHPMSIPSVHLDLASQSIEVQHLAGGGSQPLFMHALALAETEIVRLTLIRRANAPDEYEQAVGVRAGDLIGEYAFGLPSTEALEEATIAYQDVFAADDSQVKQWFEGKLVVIGDVRRFIPGRVPDWHETPDGRMVSGPHAHLAAIDSLLRETTLRYPRPIEYIALMAFAAVVGCVIARHKRRAFSIQIVMLIAGFVLFIAICIAGFRYYGYLSNPFSPALSMLVAFGAALLIRTDPLSGEAIHSHQETSS